MRSKIFFPILFLILSGFFVYAFNFDNSLFWDDDDWIINNVFVHGIGWDNIKFWLSNNTLAGVGLQSNYYRPFLFFTFAFNWIISGIEPLLWHLTNNALHIANAVLVFVLLRKYLGQAVAFLSSLIFVIHPLNTEAVTYIAGRGDPLSVFLMLLALWLFVKSRTIASGELRDKSLNIFWLLSLVSMFLAILSRETVIIFPLLLMVFYISFLSRDKFVAGLKKAFIISLPFWLISIVYGILRLTILNFQNTLNFYAASNLYSENLLYRLFTFMHVLVDYFRLLFVPVGLHMERSMIVHTSLFQWPVWLGTVVVLGILYMIYRLYKNGSPDYKIWFFSWGWFFVGLIMVSGVTPINAVIYEHFLYLPMIGFWTLVSYYLVKLFSYFKTRSLNFVRNGLAVALAVYFVFFGWQAIQRNILWGKPIEFFEDILRYEPESVRVLNNLGNLYSGEGNIVKAEEFYQKAANLDDVFAQPHFNLGAIKESRGDIFGAIGEYEKAIEIDPNFPYAYQNLVVIYANQGDLVKAAEYIEVLKVLTPHNPRIFYNAGLIYLARNDIESAIRDLERALEISGSDPQAQQEIRVLLEQIK